MFCTACEFSWYKSVENSLKKTFFSWHPIQRFVLVVYWTPLQEDKHLDYTGMASRRNAQYSRLPTYENEDDDYDGGGRRRNDPRFDYSPNSFDKIPWKSIVLALFLLFLGCLLLLLSFFIFTGHMGGHSSQAYGLLGLGLLTFLPGFYETRIAYYSWRGAQGYRFGSIPDY